MAPEPFRPWRPLRGAHAQTIVSSLWPAPRVPGPRTPLIVAVDDRAAVRVDVHRARSPRGTMLLIHGMCGSSESSYMRHTARLALQERWTVARMNLRNCGGTEALSGTLYNAGQSDDVDRVLAALDDARFPRPFVAAGFSLGGNILLRYAGRAGAGARLDALAAVNPPIDLASCARAIERPTNRIYQAYYVRRLCRQLRRIRRRRTVPGPPARPGSVRTIRRFDDLFTAPDAGFGDAAAYYAAASAGPTLDGVRRRTCVISAANDPFVPVEDFRPYHGLDGFRFEHPEDGGHCGYWQAGTPRSWSSQALVGVFDEWARRSR